MWSALLSHVCIAEEKPLERPIELEDSQFIRSPPADCGESALLFEAEALLPEARAAALPDVYLPLYLSSVASRFCSFSHCFGELFEERPLVPIRLCCDGRGGIRAELNASNVAAFATAHDDEDEDEDAALVELVLEASDC